jgi:hypothetical protein
MNEQKSLQVAVRLFPFEADNHINPWGDYTHVLALAARIQSDEPMIPPMLYFKVHKTNGFLAQITEAEFNESCVAAAHKKATSIYQEFKLS